MPSVCTPLNLAALPGVTHTLTEADTSVDPATLITAIELGVTAVRPFTTAESFRLQATNDTVTAELGGTWSGPSGSNLAQPGLDYWQLDNFDTSTGVYGWERLYSSGSGLSFTSLGNHSDHWYGTSSFDVVFRFARPDWLFVGDLAYSKLIAQLWNQVSGGTQRAWTVYTYCSSGSPTTADVSLSLSVVGYGSVGVTLATLRAAGFAANNVPDWFKCSRNGTALSISASHDGTSWTTVATGTGTGTPNNPGTYILDLGGNQFNTWNGRSGMDGVLSEFEYHVAGSLVADLGLDGATSTSATSWTAPATGRTVTRNGGTLLGGANGTIRPRFTLATPTPLADLAVYIPAMLSGEATIDEWCLDYITDGGWSVGFLKF